MKKKKIITIAAIVSLSACTDTQEAQHVLEAQGFSDVVVTGYRFTGCGKDDNVRTGFEATSINGTPVTGVVCSGIGWGKSSTVRID